MAPDWMTEHGAHVLAARVVAYWKERGHHFVQVWVEKGQKYNKTGAPIYVVRSNLLNGAPRRVR